jgi:hypothetical protein
MEIEMKTVSVTNTAVLLDEMASKMRSAADEMESLAKRMKTENDITLAAEGANVISNLFPNLRLDLLVSRPIRAMERASGE